jgi:hypothetical protein
VEETNDRGTCKDYKRGEDNAVYDAEDDGAPNPIDELESKPSSYSAVKAEYRNFD